MASINTSQPSVVTPSQNQTPPQTPPQSNPSAAYVNNPDSTPPGVTRPPQGMVARDLAQMEKDANATNDHYAGILKIKLTPPKDHFDRVQNSITVYRGLLRLAASDKKYAALPGEYLKKMESIGAKFGVNFGLSWPARKGEKQGEALNQKDPFRGVDKGQVDAYKNEKNTLFSTYAARAGALAKAPADANPVDPVTNPNTDTPTATNVSNTTVVPPTPEQQTPGANAQPVESQADAAMKAFVESVDVKNLDIDAFVAELNQNGKSGDLVVDLNEVQAALGQGDLPANARTTLQALQKYMQATGGQPVPAQALAATLKQTAQQPVTPPSDPSQNPVVPQQSANPPQRPSLAGFDVEKFITQVNQTTDDQITGAEVRAALNAPDLSAQARYVLQNLQPDVPNDTDTVKVESVRATLTAIVNRASTTDAVPGNEA